MRVALGRDDQWVDLDEAGVGVQEQLGKVHHDLDRLADLLALQADGEGDLAGLEAKQALVGGDGFFDDLFRGLGGDLFDVHAAFAAGHEHRAALGAVHDDAQVVLLGDVHAAGDQQLLHRHALGRRLRGDQVLAEDGGRRLGRVGGGFHQLHAAAFAAAPGVHLGLDHRQGGAVVGQLLKSACGLIGGVDHHASGHGDVERLEQLAGLVFVDLHGGRIAVWGREGGCQGPKAVVRAEPIGP